MVGIATVVMCVIARTSITGISSVTAHPPARCLVRPSLACEALWVKWTGEGRSLFSVRVDLVAPDEDAGWGERAFDALIKRLPFTSGTGRALAGADQGRGHEGVPVVGLTFLLRATNFGEAADLAVETAVAAGEEAGVGNRVYDVVMVPEDSLVLPESERTIPIPD